MSITFRQATRDDVPLILRFIRQMAEYETLAHEVTATEDTLAESLFAANATTEIWFAELFGEAAAFALFFPSYATYQGTRSIYVENFFVRSEYRRQGVGRALFRHIIQLAKRNACEHIEWAAQDRNETAKDFYSALGAEPLSGLSVYRLPKKQFT